MAIATADMRHGLKVTTGAENGEWEVLDRHPLNRTWWLHRWNDAGEWETDYAHEDYMTAVSELSPAVTEREKWCRAPFNTANTKTGVPGRKMGYALGKWGTHKPAGNYGWTVTHLPTGFSVPTDKILGYRCTIAEVRAVIEMLASHDFPTLDSLPFGQTPPAEARPELERLKSLLTPKVLQEA